MQFALGDFLPRRGFRPSDASAWKLKNDDVQAPRADCSGRAGVDGEGVEIRRRAAKKEARSPHHATAIKSQPEGWRIQGKPAWLALHSGRNSGFIACSIDHGQASGNTSKPVSSTALAIASAHTPMAQSGSLREFFR